MGQKQQLDTPNYRQKSMEMDIEVPRYKVIMHNDDVTTMDFVVKVLMQVFFKSQQDAEQIMLQVHCVGSAVVGVYVYDIARTKIARVDLMAMEEGFPLKLTMEPEGKSWAVIFLVLLRWIL